MSKAVQSQKFSLAGSGVSSSATSIELVTLNTPDGTAITMTDFGSDVGYATMEPGTSREESISFTGITGTTLTGVSRGLRFVSPFDVVAGNKKTHAGGTILVFSNTSAFYSRFVDDFNAQTIGGIKTFSSIPVLPASNPTTDNQAARKAYVDTKVSLTGDETIAGVKTFSSLPTIPITPSASTDAASKGYVDSVAVAGAPNASTTVKGIVEEATQSEVNAGTATGGTGAQLFVNPSSLEGWAAQSSSIKRLNIGGDGSDGALSISSGTTTLTRDMYYTDLSITGTAILNAAGYRVYVRGTLTVDSSSGARLSNNGGAGGNGTDATSVAIGTAGAAGAAASAGTLPGGLVGKAGVNGVSVSGSSFTHGLAGIAGSGTAIGLGSNGVAGGNGSGAGSASGGAGGAAGTKTGTVVHEPRSYVWANNLYQFPSATSTSIERFTASASGGSGGSGGVSGNGGSGSAFSGGSGGSGGTGGFVFVECRDAVFTGSNCVTAAGGAGGSGGASNGAGGGSSGGSGGGAGGAGGVVIFIYQTLTGTAIASSVTAPGGAGGTGGAGFGTIAGLDGNAGNAGTTYTIHMEVN